MRPRALRAPRRLRRENYNHYRSHIHLGVRRRTRIADLATRLQALKAEQQRLERKQAELLEKRRTEIGKLAEKLGLFEADDDLLAGALLELEAAFAAKDLRLEEWRSHGAAFRKRTNAKAAASAAGRMSQRELVPFAG
jgi:hypothetical protein